VISLTRYAQLCYACEASPKMSVPEILKFVFGVVIWTAFALYDMFFIGLDFSFYAMLLFINSIGSFKAVNLRESVSVSLSLSLSLSLKYYVLIQSFKALIDWLIPSLPPLSELRCRAPFLICGRRSLFPRQNKLCSLYSSCLAS